ncbi:hypothetical protein BCR35DRAFT_354712 [Leucosporidium creatinivorum]|uniref:BRCA1-associated protein 2-domain-containing protein n=1 Tax=Leucosporidium creatinivorum TaxID=106004 RepID=A0A1Y2EC55_9BASI|nr:hypothetical protein BCR35DRAFT_354712 [Leucosporidium creatinivorum]
MAERRYSIVIELFDHHALPSHPSPLQPRTPTRLPPQLDAQLRASSSRLVLPASNRDFWLPLPATSSLSTLATAPVTSPPPPPTRALSSPRIWSQSSGPLSPPAIATAQLWTPSQPPPPSTSTPAATGQQPQLDFRFGPLAIDWVDSPTAAPLRSSPMSPSLSAPSLPSEGSSSSSSAPPLQWNPTSPRPSSALALPKPRSPPRTPEKSGRTELNWGIIHLFRESGAQAEESDEKQKRKAMDGDDGTVVGMVSVPGVLTAASLLTFISPALESVAQLRLLRDSTPNRTIVLIRFYEAADASLFLKMYNGRSYHDTKDSEVAQVVPISSIQLKSSSNPPFTFPSTPQIDESQSKASEVELPTCPICLERLDVQISGLVQILCQHSYHCSCLLKWGDSRCPVCRSTNSRARRGTVGAASAPPNQAVASTCAVCQSPSNLWICVICGNVGCGRYQGGHAHSHFDESGHSYSLEIETGRVWSYNDDEYVHRLIRNRTDGKLVELPSLFTDDDSKKKSSNSKDDEGIGGPDRSDEASQDKLEAMGLEYANLMTTQLESQRGYYEEEIARAKEEGAVWRAKWESVGEEAEKGRVERRELRKRVGELEGELKKSREEWREREEKREKSEREEEVRRKKERAEATKARRELERELEQEKSVTASLSTNLGLLRTEFGKRGEETEGVKAQVAELEEQMRDLMFALSARDQIEQQGGEAVGGDVVIPPTPPPTSSARRKKKK